MLDLDEILPITDVKRDLLKLVKRVDELKQVIAITKKGKATALLMSMEEYEGLIETIEILSDPELVKQLKKARHDIKKGKFVTDDEVWGE